MENKVYIKEIFKSIQGEGIYIGYEQLFIRFTECNLHCKYCDTDFFKSSTTKQYNKNELAEIVNSHKNIHSISLTGGEPLKEYKFLKEFLPLVKNKIYLETNGTLYNELEEIINLTDIISMDIKLNSACSMGNLFDIHSKFIDICAKYNKETFFKVVFNANIITSEINETAKLAKKYNIPIILQPETRENIICISKDDILNIFQEFKNLYKNIRLIPQVHKFLNIE